MKTFDFVTSKNSYAVPMKYKNLTSVSSIIRAMTKDGFSRSQISRTTKIRYQHVRNVLVTPLKS